MDTRKRSRTRISFDVPLELKDAATYLAHKKNISLAALSCRALARYMREQQLIKNTK